MSICNCKSVIFWSRYECFIVTIFCRLRFSKIEFLLSFSALHEYLVINLFLWFSPRVRVTTRHPPPPNLHILRYVPMEVVLAEFNLLLHDYLRWTISTNSILSTISIGTNLSTKFFFVLRSLGHHQAYTESFDVLAVC